MNIDLKRDPMEKINNLENQTLETKTFFQDSFRIHYQNTSKIYSSQDNDCGSVKVNNYSCCQEGQSLYKVTEIVYQNKIIRIEDKLQVSIDSLNLGQSCSFSQGKNEIEGKNSSRTIQKVRIFKRNSTKEPKLWKKDKKNIVKNIVKLFLTWLQKRQSGKSSSLYEDSLKELKKLIESQNFNNRLIQKMIVSNEVNKSFLEFVEGSAEDDIKYSRIQDKQSHYQALEIYKSLLARRHNNMGPISSNSEAEQSESQRELNNSSVSQSNSSFSKSPSLSKEAGFKIKSPYESSNKITVIQNDKKQ